MVFSEENPTNPTFSPVKLLKPEYHFLIKYVSDEDRRIMAEIVLKIIRMHEILDFHVEEKKAFIENRITYNEHTIALGKNMSFESVEAEFSKYMKKE